VDTAEFPDSAGHTAAVVNKARTADKVEKRRKETFNLKVEKLVAF
jgi:hypothetical protein